MCDSGCRCVGESAPNCLAVFIFAGVSIGPRFKDSSLIKSDSRNTRVPALSRNITSCSCLLPRFRLRDSHDRYNLPSPTFLWLGGLRLLSRQRAGRSGWHPTVVELCPI